MYNKGVFLNWWTAQNLQAIGLSTLSIDAGNVNTEAWKKSLYWVFCNGLLLGDKTAHLTITPDKANETFEYFHFTLDMPDCKFDKKTQSNVRCDHLFFVTDEVGTVRLTTSLYDGEGKAAKADSHKGLTHNASFLAKKVQGDIDKIMTMFSFTRMNQLWQQG